MNTEAFIWANIKKDTATKLAGDASTREYFRFQYKSKNAILMVFKQDELSVKQAKRFEQIYNWLNKLGIATPDILDISPNGRYYILEDLGDTTLELWLKDKHNDSNILKKYEILSDYLNLMQSTPPPSEILNNIEPLDSKRMYSELCFFHKYYFKENKKFEYLYPIYKKLATEISSATLKTAHRDYHCRNVMIKNNKLYLVDFQDTMPAHPLYDIVSLLYDAYYDPGENLRNNIIKNWKDIEKLPLVALQRNIKAIGTFAYQVEIRKKDLYKNYIPRCISYIKKHLNILTQYNELRIITKE